VRPQEVDLPVPSRGGTCLVESQNRQGPYRLTDIHVHLLSVVTASQAGSLSCALPQRCQRKRCWSLLSRRAAHFALWPPLITPTETLIP